MHWDLMYRPPSFHPFGTCPSCGYCPCCGRSARPGRAYPAGGGNDTGSIDSKYEEMKKRLEEYEKRNKTFDVTFRAGDAKRESLFDVLFGADVNGNESRAE